MGAQLSSPPRRAKKYGNNTPYYPSNSSTPMGESRNDGFMGFGRGTNQLLNNAKAIVSQPLRPSRSPALRHLKEPNRPRTKKITKKKSTKRK